MKKALVSVLMLLVIVASAMATTGTTYKDKSCVYEHTHGGWENVCTDTTRSLDLGGILKGDKGDKGDKGEQGEQGIQGIQGNDGKDGLNGIDGKDGKDGEDGQDGSDATVDLTPVEDRLFVLENPADTGNHFGYSRFIHAMETTVLEWLKGIFTQNNDFEAYKLEQEQINREQNKRIFACESALGMTEGY